jgi:hypothetical protein
MSHAALVAAIGAVLAAALPSPGLFVAIGLGIAAIGAGWVGFQRTGDPGFTRLAGAAAMTLGTLGGVLGGLRVALAVAAIGHLDRLIAP